MAVNKIITAKASTHYSLKACLSYVLRNDKTPDKLIGVTSPYNYNEINVKNVYDTFITEKQSWDKDSGRMYMHSVLSFHRDEYITAQEAYDIGYKLASEDPFYNEYQTVISVHQERSHIHVHFVTNTVSYIDGHKEHHSANDIRALMERTNQLCRELGLTVTHKGQHFDGTPIEDGNISTYHNNEYRLHQQYKSSWKRDILDAVLEAVKQSSNKEEFIKLMNDRGIATTWNDQRKHISFTDSDGFKIRSTTLAKTFNINYLNSKEALESRITNNIENHKNHTIELPNISTNSIGNTANTVSSIIINQIRDTKNQEQHNAQHL